MVSGCAARAVNLVTNCGFESITNGPNFSMPGSQATDWNTTSVTAI
jgi:hypothetical protein